MSITAEQLGAALADRYTVDRELGRGGMATVYLARDLKHDRWVALKLLHPELAAALGAERFLKEIRTTAQLQHPHILPLYDSGTAPAVDDGSGTQRPYFFYTMPFVEGESLSQRITRDGQLPIADAVRLTAEVASALEYAHRHGVIHRDIKPANILLSEGSALVADFGIALKSNSGDTRLTQTGMSLGTPAYMSPEQALGEREPDARSDVYAVGAMLYEMLTGVPPFVGPTGQSVIARVLTETPVAPTRLRKVIPRQLEDVVLTALEKDPAHRFATAGALQSALSGETVSPRKRASRKRPVWWTVGAGIVVAIVALAVRTWSARSPTVIHREPFAAAVRLASVAFDSATKRTPKGCASAIALYSQATEVDTLYAEAWGGLAKTHALCALFTDNPNVEFPAAKSAAARALSLNPNLSSALTASGLVHVFHEQDFAAAQHDFALALKNDPTQYEAWLFRTWAYLGENQPDSAELALRMAKALRPFGDQTVGVRLATILRVRGDLDGAEREVQQLLSQDSASRFVKAEMFELEISRGQCDRARAYSPLFRVGGSQRDRAIEASFRAKCGQAEGARHFADSVTAEAAAGNYVDNIALATVYAALGDSAKLFRTLNDAVLQHNWELVLMPTLWAFQPYRNTPQFVDIMRRARVK